MTTKKTKLVMYNQRCFSQKHRAKTSLRKIFPVSNKAIDVRDALVRIATQAGPEDPLKEVNGKTMEPILQPGLFFAGEYWTRCGASISKLRSAQAGWAVARTS